MMANTAASGAGGGAIDCSGVLPPGAKAGPWQVERELGRGGMGAVYAVVHDEIGKRAALKVVHQRLLVPGFNSDRMLLEAKVVNQVGHPNIVDIFETGKLADGRPYIVMERLEGRSLSARADDGKLLPDQVIAILLQVCDALSAAHHAGIIHRDLKLDNVFLVDNPDDPATPKVKLLDWGIAKVLSHDVKHTIEGQLVGTPQYLAPEQARGHEVSSQTDVYSLGVMAYELFLEQLPFEAETAAEVMAMHLRATPPPPRDLWPDIPALLEDLLLAMLAKQPAQRPSVAEVIRRLGEIREELTRRCQAYLPPPRHPTAQPIDPERPARAISSTGFAPTEPAAWRPTTKRWKYAVGALALAISVMMLWVSRASDHPASAATTIDAVRSADGIPSASASASASDDAANLPAALGPLGPLGGPGRPAPALVSDLEQRTTAAPTAPAAHLGLVSAPARAGRPIADRPIADRPIADRPTADRITAPRPSAARPATVHKSPAAPRRATKFDPDGTLDVYR
ncbi:MAG TPA: protein kinase [Kofleriaceae bacterium]|nr:protein kinase [Kofleriaceae bacterium]